MILLWLPLVVINAGGPILVDAPEGVPQAIGTAPARVTCPSTTRHVEYLIRRLRELPNAEAECLFPDRQKESAANFAADPGLYFSEAGPCAEVLDVVVLYYDTTGPICAELQQLGADGRENYVDALYRVLGRIADPHSIPFLRAALRGPQQAYVFRSWLDDWGCAGSPARSHTCRSWIGDLEMWARFLPEVYRAAPDNAARLAVLRKMASTLFESPTIEFMRRLEKDGGVGGRERMVVASYLLQIGEPVDGDALTQALAVVKAEDAPRDSDWVLFVELPHEAVVPFLIERLPSLDSQGLSAYIESAIKGVTLVTGMSGAETWHQWWEHHRTETRAQWVARAVEEIDRAIPNDLDRARQLVADFYALDSAEAFVAAERWAKHNDLRDAVAKLVCKRYHPYWRRQCQRVVEEALGATKAGIQADTIRMLQDLDFVPTKPGHGWHEYIRDLWGGR